MLLLADLLLFSFSFVSKYLILKILYNFLYFKIKYVYSILTFIKMTKNVFSIYNLYIKHILCKLDNHAGPKKSIVESQA